MVRSPRRRLPHLRPVSPVLAARRMLDEIGGALSMAIVIRSVEGLGPVTIEASVIYGRASADFKVSAATESAALREIGRRAITWRGADEQWFLRYGLGAG